MFYLINLFYHLRGRAFGPGGNPEQKGPRMPQNNDHVKDARTALEAEAYKVVQDSNRLRDNLRQAGKKIWYYLLFVWAIVIIAGISYFFVSHPTPRATKQTPEEHPAAFSGTPEGQALINLLTQMRQAQLKKDIHLLFEAYSPKFPDLARRRQLMAEIWKKYDYLDSHFYLSDIIVKNKALILAKVTWVIKARDRQTNKTKTFSKTYQVYFSKDSGKWLILKFGPETTKENIE
jgi:hypothetical protein